MLKVVRHWGDPAPGYAYRVAVRWEFGGTVWDRNRDLQATLKFMKDLAGAQHHQEFTWDLTPVAYDALREWVDRYNREEQEPGGQKLLL